MQGKKERERESAYVAAGKVTTLEHEVGDDAVELVELGVGVSKTLLASAESTEVLDRLRDDVVVKLKVDAASTCWEGRCHHVLCCQRIHRYYSRLAASSLEVTFPEASVWYSGPVHDTSKCALTTMLAAEAWNERPTAGTCCLRRSERTKSWEEDEEGMVEGAENLNMAAINGSPRESSWFSSGGVNGGAPFPKARRLHDMSAGFSLMPRFCRALRKQLVGVPLCWRG